MLNFIGSGSAFNTELGNNSAFLSLKKDLFLIDCGSTVFSRLKEKNTLDNYDDVYVAITHTHPDHIGSLGDLVFYLYYVMNKKLKIITHVENSYILRILENMGISSELYNTILTNKKLNLNNELKLKMIPVKHTPEVNSFALEINYNDKNIYYSGDCSEIPENIISNLNNGKYNYFYQDTCSLDYDGNVHLSINKLNSIITKNRNLVYCMHLDEEFNRKYAEELGFNVVENI
ncbi:metallo-beta-lactamase superfamily protein [Bacillus phage vB_BpuM-BpSp]|nr:metallo-beta-lactamase superfamily protein [Bacillus phage vB_BpuM-BpSp]